MNVENSATEKYIREHIHRVQKRMYILINELYRRCETHDRSKLGDEERDGWEAMDNEPRYEYGSEEYFKKVERYKWLLDRHYSNRENRHHPEHFGEWWQSEMDILDLVEMICDWCAYKEEISADQAFDTIETQIKRFNVPKPIEDILKNTILRYFVKRPEDEEVPSDAEINPLETRLSGIYKYDKAHDFPASQSLKGVDEELGKFSSWIQNRLKKATV